MNRDFEKFLIGTVGIKEDVLAQMLSDDEMPEDFNFEEVVAVPWQESNKAVVLSKYGDSFAKSKMDKQFDIYKGGQNQKLNQKFELGLSRKEAEDKTHEEILDLINSTFNSRIENAAISTDEDLKKSLSTLKTSATTWRDKYETLHSESEEKINAAMQGAANTVKNYQITDMFRKELSGMEWGVPSVQVPKWQKLIMDEIKEKYPTVGIDGSLVDEKGEKPVNFEGNGTYKHVSEPIQYLFNTYNLSAVSNGGVASGNSNTKGRVTTDTMGENAKALAERMEKHRR